MRGDRIHIRGREAQISVTERRQDVFLHEVRGALGVGRRGLIGAELVLRIGVKPAKRSTRVVRITKPRRHYFLMVFPDILKVGALCVVISTDRRDIG
jgi:hypothetical protein